MAVNKASMRNQNFMSQPIAPLVNILPPTQKTSELEKIILELNIIIKQQRNQIEKVKNQHLKYATSAKGKEARRRASRKYWAKTRSGKKPGRPKKIC